MRLSLFMRAARASAATTLVLLLNFQPSFARMAAPASAPPSARPATSPGHFRFDARGLGRFGFNRSGASDFGFDRFASSRFNFGPAGRRPVWLGPMDHVEWQRMGVESVGPRRMGRLGRSRPPRRQNQPRRSIIDGGGPQVAITVNAGLETGAAGSGYPAGCVIHKVIYDRAGKYVGERQTPEC